MNKDNQFQQPDIAHVKTQLIIGRSHITGTNEDIKKERLVPV